MTQSAPRKLLIAEDNEADVFLLRTALEDAGLSYEAEIARDGEKALALLDQAGRSAGKTYDAMILDLNLVTHTGIQILGYVRAHPVLARLPVVILTSSESPADRRDSEMLGVSAYFRKSMDLADFMRMGTEIAALLSVSPAAP